MESKLIYIVIPVLNRWVYTSNCLDNLLNQTYKSYKIVIVDHGSNDGTVQNIKSNYPQVALLSGDKSMWWAGATNLGVKYAIDNNADYVLTINNDVSVGVDYLQQLINSTLEKPNSLIGSISLNKYNECRIAFAGVKFNKWTAKYKQVYDQRHSLIEIQNDCRFIKSDLLPGRGTLIPIFAFKKIGLFDVMNFPHYAADEDFSAKCEKYGYGLFVSTFSVVIIEDTKNANEHKSLSKIFFSKRSPVNIVTRWNWANQHGVIPVLYFFLDILRISYSVFFKKSNV